ncbi:IS3 family transposase domain protein [Candidatus Bealeia paramacronuclearis]|uniref:IS3 family transposase domain protein n=1 Tax=Candidatus Bealeia paramacronuclearis TaxID=1921001 RepID=A0ABZ2C4V7_9PROT|nr:IS3 family transposase domain protein [Candidatus Bealeia paramacronuclearis]
MRKSHSKDFKFKVALEVIRGEMTIAQIVLKYQVADSLVHKWKKQLLSDFGPIHGEHFQCLKAFKKVTSKPLCP